MVTQVIQKRIIPALIVVLVVSVLFSACSPTTPTGQSQQQATLPLEAKSALERGLAPFRNIVGDYIIQNVQQGRPVNNAWSGTSDETWCVFVSFPKNTSGGAYADGLNRWLVQRTGLLWTPSQSDTDGFRVHSCSIG